MRLRTARAVKLMHPAFPAAVCRSAWSQAQRASPEGLAAVARGETQIPPHMCYAGFNDILPAIEALDVDVITIETSRSKMELLDGFGTFHYSKKIGPGVYEYPFPSRTSCRGDTHAPAARHGLDSTGAALGQSRLRA